MRVTSVGIAIILLGLILRAGTGQQAVARNGERSLASGAFERNFDHEHRAWTVILGHYVENGVVDYGGLADRGRPALQAYLDQLVAASPGESSWTREERLAFWVNAYNAFTIRLVLDHYPVKSIRSIGFLPLAAFRTKFIPLGASRASISLNTLENEILRRQFNDARIHFAIVCASKSCPQLWSEAYRARVIDQQLNLAGRVFLGDTSKNRWDAATQTLYLSSIFKWFRDDFERDSGTLPDFVSRFMPSSYPSAIGRKVRIVFLDYDWSLNGR